VRLVCYIQCGLGDFYDLFTILPDFIEKNSVDHIRFYIDSIYFNNGRFQKQKESVIDLMRKFGGDYTIVPEECNSYSQLYYDDIADRPLGPQYDKIKNDFLFYSKQQTKSYIKSKLKDDDLFIHSIMGINFTYLWKNNTNTLLTEYKRIPVELDLTPEESFNIFQLLKDYDTILQVRKKGAGETDDYFRNIYKTLTNKGHRVLVINLDGVNIPGSKDYSKLSLAEIFHLVANIKYMITSSSILGFHRIHFNKKTIVNTPYRNGSNELIFSDYINNSNYLFLNAEIDNTKLIKEEIDTWQS